MTRQNQVATKRQSVRAEKEKSARNEHVTLAIPHLGHPIWGYTRVMLQKGSRHGDESVWAQQNED
jgi:hypothetical protein